jgi:hypothetical protein
MTRRSERGMTLIEIVAGIVVMGIIFPALTQAVLIGLRTLDNTNERIAGSNDTLLVASYFTSDVEGASALATGGTRAQVTPPVALPSGTTNTALLLFYAARGALTIYSPPTAGTVWNSSAGALTSSLADEILPINDDNRDNTLARVATTTAPTSSVTHTVALRTTGNVTRRGMTSGAVANGAALVLGKPAGLVAGDVMVAQVTAATAFANVTAPSGWALIPGEARDLSPTLSSQVFTKVATATEPLSYTWGFAPGAGDHDIAGGVAAYTNISTSSPVVAHANAANPCGGETPLLSVATADNLAVSSASYFFETHDGENQLVRRTCSGSAVDGVQVLARDLQATSATTIACEPVACDPLPASVSLRLREPPMRHETRGRSYVLSARSRTG